MERWEHRSVYISRTQDNWIVDFGNGEVLAGMDRILDEYGAKGWELVSFVPHAWRATAGQAGPFEVIAYRAIFKRRVQAPAPAA